MLLFKKLGIRLLSFFKKISDIICLVYKTISEDAISSNYFVGYDFKANLLCIQQAIILYFMGY
jgi:hypothetical protein